LWKNEPEAILALPMDHSSPRDSSAPATDSQIRTPTSVATTSIVQVRSWLVPLIAAVALAVLGFATNQTLRNTIGESLSEQLTTILDADVHALELWLENHRIAAGHHAGDPRIRSTVEALVRRAQRTPGGTEALLESAEAAELATILDDVVESYGYEGYFVVDRTARSLAAQFRETVGQPAAVDLLGYIRQVFEGDTVVTRPAEMPVPNLPDATVNRGGRPIMFVGAPVFSESGEVLAILAFGIPPEEDFTEILSVARMGGSGETYAFDANGLMISDSRFEDQLRSIGLLPDTAVSAVLRISVRDPGGNMVEGFEPEAPRAGWPLTRMAASATSRDDEDSVDVDGYRDYRGVKVVGAWTWLEEYGFGVTTEVDEREAFQTYHTLRFGLAILLALLVAVSAGILISTHVIGKLRRDVVEAEQLGQYRLDEKIGEGGMGKVYRASHSLLRRPTAIKLLRPDRTSPKGIARFEREVQLTSQLTHPNTVAVYDYGRTPDGVFYYAMEYLDGITLNKLVGRYGPQPQERVLHILKQACGSLAEAHGEGLIHRDIKPSNLMLCERGGAKDVIKVLDFGLVRELEPGGNDPTITGTTALTGTPLYLSPEVIHKSTAASPRSDMYALGAVGYYLLVGDHVFAGESVIEVCGHHMNTIPEPPTSRTDNPISRDLERLVLLCLEKDPVHRPADARTLLERLEQITDVPAWSDQDATSWWATHRRPSEETWHVDFDSGAESTPGHTPDSRVVVDVHDRGD
jgi:serine/threonine protein kinase